MDQSYLRMMMKVRHLDHPYSICTEKRAVEIKKTVHHGRGVRPPSLPMECDSGRHTITYTQFCAPYLRGGQTTSEDDNALTSPPEAWVFKGWLRDPGRKWRTVGGGGSGTDKRNENS